MAQYPTSTATSEVPPQPWQKAQSTTPKKTNWLGIVALILAVVALVAVIIMSIVWGTMAYGSKANVWNLVQGSSSGTSDNFTPEPSDLYISNNFTPFTLNIKKPKTSLEGRLFIIDNTRSSARITITSTELTSVDNVGGGKVEPGTTAIYLGLSDTSFERLI